MSRHRSGLLLLIGLAGCSTDPGRVQDVSPSALLLGRTTDVTIHGVGTHFGEQSRIDLGPGLTVLALSSSVACDLSSR